MSDLEDRMRMSASTRRFVGLALTTTMATSVALLTGGTVAQAETQPVRSTAVSAASNSQSAEWGWIQSNSGGAWLRAQPYQDAYGMEYLGNGTDVLMICWKDAGWATGNYRSNRWFKVEPAYDPAVGFVHSSLVAGQKPLPQCP